MGFGYSSFGAGFGAFGVLFTLMFVLILGVFIVILVKGISTWNRNNHAPRLTVNASVVSKRTDVSRHSHAHAHGAHTHHHSSTWYYATFQVDSGDRIEFSVSGPEFGMLAEGDQGSLSFQGTRYLSFERR